MARALLLALFAATVLCNIAFVKLSVGLPLRAILAITLLLLVEWLYSQAVRDALYRCRYLLLFILYFAIIGAILTFANGYPPAGAISVIIENHVQSAVSIVLVYSLCIVLGLAAVSKVVAGIILVSIGFAVLQFTGFQPAWDFKHSLDLMQGVIPQTVQIRPGGLSYTPVHLGYQTSILFALAVVWAVVTRQRSFLIWGLVAVLVASIAGGNRSPLLSIAAFVLIYVQRIHPRVLLYLLPAIVVLLPLSSMIMEAATSAEVRALEAGDASSLGRLVLSYYGVLLVATNIFGHGLLFDTQMHWPQFWDLLRGFENATIVQRYGLHNYPLNMLVTYGIFVIPPLVFLYKSTRVLRLFFWSFMIYFINSLTHNEGPLHADNMFWYGAVCVLFLAQNSKLDFHSQLSGSPDRATLATEKAGRPAGAVNS